MKKFISFSGGVESTTMCVLFGHEADAIFADTGFEHDLVYDQIEKVEKYCKSFHRSDFVVHKIKSKHGTLPDKIVDYAFYPSFKSRYCTRMFKIEPIDDFLEQYKSEDVFLMIGLNADETDRMIGDGHGNKKFVKYSYPLAELGIDRDSCKLILTAANILPDYPVYMKRGGCVGCFYKSVNSYKAMAVLAPEEFAIVEELEEKLHTAQKQLKGENQPLFKILGDPTKPSMKQIRESAKMELFDLKDVYANINDVTNCGVFCNR